MLILPEWLPEWFVVGLVLLTGLVVGSFVTMASYRMPRDESIVMGRSHCTGCNKALGVLALFPVLSWLWQRGKCRYCSAKVSARYPITELTQALLFLSVYATQGISWAGLILALLSVALLIMVVVDFEWYIIPDEIQIACVVLALAYHWVVGTSLNGILAGAGMGLLLGFGLRFGYGWLRKKEGLGWGDVKFLFVAGLWMASLMDWAPFLFYSGILGVATAIVWRLLGHGERFPFGPALAGALFLSLLTPSTALFFWTMARIYA